MTDRRTDGRTDRQTDAYAVEYVAAAAAAEVRRDRRRRCTTKNCPIEYMRGNEDGSIIQTLMHRGPRVCCSGDNENKSLALPWPRDEQHDASSLHGVADPAIHEVA